MLNMLEGFELGKYGSSSPEANHLLIEVMRRAFADRAEFMGDPDYVRVPVQELASKQYAQERARSIDYNRATPSAQIGHGNPEPHEVPHTTHYSVVDSEGNAVSNTYTLGINWAGGLMITGAGFLINNNMDDFAAKPGEPNYFGFRAGEANAIASGKRPVSSMAPTIVLEESKPSLIIGSPGGTSIPNAVLQVLVNVLDHRLSIQQAIEAPRLHHQWLPDVVNYETARYSSSLLDGLRAKGHKVEPYYMPYIGVCNGVAITGNGLRIGSADPRNPDGEASGA